MGSKRTSDFVFSKKMSAKIGLKIYRLRVEKKMSQLALAERASVYVKRPKPFTQGEISGFETGKRANFRRLLLGQNNT